MRQRRSAAAPGDSGRPPGGAAAGRRTSPPARCRVLGEAARGSATIGSSGAVAGGLQPRAAHPDRSHSLERGRMKTVFFDIDSQLDFLYPAGALYVPRAERIVPAI